VKRIVILAIGAALCAVGFTGGTALAFDRSVTPFTATYPGPDAKTTWMCSGNHIVQNHIVKDVETCLITGDTAGWVAAVYHSDAELPCEPNLTPPLTGVCGPFEPPLVAFLGGYAPWFSDYGPENNANAIRWKQDVRAASHQGQGNGSFTDGIVAYYSS
jgi:hypothetical protein